MFRDTVPLWKLFHIQSSDSIAWFLAFLKSKRNNVAQFLEKNAEYMYKVLLQLTSVSGTCPPGKMLELDVPAKILQKFSAVLVQKMPPLGNFQRSTEFRTKIVAEI